ncbi:hypothetical protein D6D01_09771 [Aureobasidium pullulans]|uniref:Cryptic loci regulator 2 N-terminal domain-containing protein n=1 Tax=Aureobasidium pullulans TaxID=5580 RepID=A0A4S9JWJ8_AURPU|nr:hypothetical protein D6D01_09771 [Aureobasidium pullulans]
MVRPPLKPNSKQRVNTIQQIDLSDPQYNSDDQGHHPKGHQVNFINALPTGYAVFIRVEYTSTSEQDPAFRMAYVFGHPSGGTFGTMRSFSRHSLSIIQDNVGVCNCRLCSGIGAGDAVQGQDLLTSDAAGTV